MVGTTNLTSAYFIKNSNIVAWFIKIYEMDSSSSEVCDDESTGTTRKKSHVCPYKNCSASFVKNSKLVYHIRRHTGERPFACDEPNCNKTYLYSFHLRRHKESHSGSQSERIKCPIPGCYLELSNKYNLKRHINRKHNISRYYPFTCNWCRQGFHKKKQLLNHTHLHTGVPSFQCVICDSFFFTSRDLSRHKRTHQKYSCKCGVTFERWTQLVAHKKNCQSIKRTCHICNRSFNQSSNFKSHLETHFTGTSNKFICGYTDCNRSYLYKKNLAIHIKRKHQKIVKRVSCTISGCTQTFCKNQNLKNHIQKFHSDTVRVPKVRKPRKDKGMPKKSTAAMLAGLELPPKMHLDVIKGLRIDLQSVYTHTLNKCSENTIDKSDDSEHDYVKVVC